ncbi:MAG TPA: hypothetical protein VIZ43_26335 [Trebonia sp.]
MRNAEEFPAEHLHHAAEGDAAGTAGAGGFAGDGGFAREAGTAGGVTWSLAGLPGEPWSARFPVARRRHDRWILVCGGVAAAAAFAAAFMASGGAASQPAAPGSTVPAVVSQACPVPVPSP